MKKQTIVMNDFKREYQYLKKPLLEATNTALENGWYVLGNEVKSFEKSFADYIGTKYCISVANGYEALYIALLALGIGKGDEVITVSHSFIATALPITMVGATAVFVDVDEYYHIDTKQVEAAITPKTKAILPVHLYGQIVDMQELNRIAKKYNLKILEDACQAHGSTYKGTKAGALGDMAAFSFYPTKNLGAFGDGGAITTNSKELYEKCLMLRNYGQRIKYDHVTFGINSRLDELQAAILNKKLPYLDEFVTKRNNIAKRYISKLQTISQIKLPKTRADNYHSFHLFVIEVEKRDALAAFLHENGIETLVHYPTPIHKQKVYEKYNGLKFPKTEEYSKSIISLPLHPLMTNEEVDYVCDVIKSFYKN